jgi:hypothetical protein
MKAASGKQLVVQAWEASATRDPGRVRAVFAPGAEWLAPPGNAAALALDGTHHLIGRDRIVQFLTQRIRQRIRRRRIYRLPRDLRRRRHRHCRGTHAGRACPRRALRQ